MDPAPDPGGGGAFCSFNLVSVKQPPPPFRQAPARLLQKRQRERAGGDAEVLAPCTLSAGVEQGALTAENCAELPGEVRRGNTVRTSHSSSECCQREFDATRPAAAGVPRLGCSKGETVLR